MGIDEYNKANMKLHIPSRPDTDSSDGCINTEWRQQNNVISHRAYYKFQKQSRLVASKEVKLNYLWL